MIGSMEPVRSPSEFLKAGILGTRIPDIFLEKSGHFETVLLFLDYFQGNSICWTNNQYKRTVICNIIRFKGITEGSKAIKTFITRV